MAKDISSSSGQPDNRETRPSMDRLNNPETSTGAHVVDGTVPEMGMAIHCFLRFLPNRQT